MQVLGIDPIHGWSSRGSWRRWWWRCCSTAWCRWWASRAAVLLQRRPAERARPARAAPPSPRSPSSATCRRRNQGAGVRRDRRDRRLVQGTQREGRPEGRGRRGEPVGGDHLHVAVRDELRDDRRVLSKSFRRGAKSWRCSIVWRLGSQLSFCGRSLAWTSRTVRRYKKEILRLLAEVSFGRGALAVVGGTVGVIAFLSFFTGTEVRASRATPRSTGCGTSNFVAFLSAYFNTREMGSTSASRCPRRSTGWRAAQGAMRIPARRRTPWKSWACPRCRSW